MTVTPRTYRGISIPLTVNARGLWGRDCLRVRLATHRKSVYASPRFHTCIDLRLRLARVLVLQLTCPAFLISSSSQEFHILNSSLHLQY